MIVVENRVLMKVVFPKPDSPATCWIVSCGPRRLS